MHSRVISRDCLKNHSVASKRAASSVQDAAQSGKVCQRILAPHIWKRVKTLEPVVLEGSALEEETELELGDPELQCPLEQKNMMTVTDESGKKFYYKIVPKPQTFERAQGGKMTSHWVDGTTWNFSNWDFGNPTKLWKTCSALSPIDGQWTGLTCYHLQPFICKY
ncbi:eosinophil granule major basic protein 2-like [Alligator mississippiensis]|uniref:Eosinophil granule major basic protein 2-like n=1 Tax=Alligator mississippiensis TaxID=8496 RepID=A0A151NV32_ALLMI|nr:eosinophil granule major basic protein 2-like [Alligator mississippiensis]